MANANEIAVAYHRWHVVSGPVGGKVYNEDGTVTYCTIPEGGQGCFYAVTTKVYTRDLAIQVDEIVNFNGALVASAGSGSGGVSEDAVGSIVGSTFKLAVGSNVPMGSADTGSIALGGLAEKRGLAIGYEANAREKSDTIALGYNAKAYGDKAVSIGVGSSCGGDFCVSLGGSSEADYSYGVALGHYAKCFHDNGTSVGSCAQSYYSGGVAVGYCSKTGGDSITIGSRAMSDVVNHAIVIGTEAEAAHPYTVVIGEKSRSMDECSVLLEARRMDSYAVLRMELLASGMECTGGDGGIGDADAFVTGGALRFTAVDKVAGTQETMTIALEQLWAMLEAAGGLKEKGGEAYYY